MFGMYVVDQNGRVLTAIYKKKCRKIGFLFLMVGDEGLEPPTFSV